MSNIYNRIKKLTRQLYPDSRPFKMPYGGIFERLHSALAKSESRAYSDAVSILNSAIADNEEFTEDDATDWERRLGLISGAGVGLDDRILAINQKINYPGTDDPRQYYLFIQQQIRDAGFDIYIYENRFPNGSGGYMTQTPEQILGTTLGASIHSPTIYHGPNQQHGGGFSHKIVNYLEEQKDATFVIGSNYRSTFYISGDPITTFASVPANRKNAFRQLILQLKPVQSVGFLFINYT